MGLFPIPVFQYLWYYVYVNIALTAISAVTVLEESGFKIKEQWSKLARYLGVSLSEREKLIELAARTQDYLTVLEKALEWWISNQQPSWEMLISSVEKCSDTSTASNMKKQLGLGMFIIYFTQCINH